MSEATKIGMTLLFEEEIRDAARTLRRLHDLAGAADGKKLDKEAADLIWPALNKCIKALWHAADDERVIVLTSIKAIASTPAEAAKEGE